LAKWYEDGGERVGTGIERQGVRNRDCLLVSFGAFLSVVLVGGGETISLFALVSALRTLFGFFGVGLLLTRPDQETTR
jgi:hypothetical protein